MRGSIISSDLPWMEDIFSIYYTKTMENTFPSNDFSTIFIAFFHILGMLSIYLGILLPPKYIWIHTLYLGLLLISYYIFDNNCFMTLYANMNTDQEMTPLYIRMGTFIKTMTFVLLISIGSNFYPEYSPFSLIKKLVLKLDS